MLTALVLILATGHCHLYQCKLANKTGNLDLDHVLYWSLLFENNLSSNTTRNPFLALRKRLTDLYTVPAISLHRQQEFKPHKAHD